MGELLSSISMEPEFELESILSSDIALRVTVKLPQNCYSSEAMNAQAVLGKPLSWI